MKFLFDLNHPAHIHFFRHPMCILMDRGHEIVVTSRDKEMAVPLLDELDIEHVVFISIGKGGMLGLAAELARGTPRLPRVKTGADTIKAFPRNSLQTTLARYVSTCQTVKISQGNR
jgi:predicted glycosyltransferase